MPAFNAERFRFTIDEFPVTKELMILPSTPYTVTLCIGLPEEDSTVTTPDVGLGNNTTLFRVTGNPPYSRGH